MLRVATLPALRTGKFGNAFWFLFIFTSEAPEWVPWKTLCYMALCLPDARDYRRCNLPASLVSYPTGSDSSDCSEKRPKLSSPEGIRTRVRRAEIRGLNHYTIRAGFLIIILMIIILCNIHCLKLYKIVNICIFMDVWSKQSLSFRRYMWTMVWGTKSPAASASVPRQFERQWGGGSCELWTTIRRYHLISNQFSHLKYVATVFIIDSTSSTHSLFQCNWYSLHHFVFNRVLEHK